jgi:hypothetical protein
MLSLNAVEASFLSEGEKRALRADFLAAFEPSSDPQRS